MSIDKLLYPRSVALIGASEKPGFTSWSANNLLGSEKNCRVYFVNPTKDQVFGKKCYPNLEALPEVVDCIVISTARTRVNDYLISAGKLGTTAAVVYASGYSEEHSEEGNKLEKELKEIAETYGITVLGPNCMGVANLRGGINLLGVPVQPAGPFEGTEPSVAIIGHSGNLICNTGKGVGFPLAYMISVGNCAVTSMEEYIEYCAEDDDIKVIALYLEGLKKPDIFVRALRKAAEKRKPVIILKTGKSEKAARSAMSHTGSLAGSYANFEATAKKFGAILVDTLDQLRCLSEAFVTLGGDLPRVPKLMDMNDSGGATTLSAEAFDAAGVQLSEISKETYDVIRGVLPGFASVNNPLDATTAIMTDREAALSILRAYEKDDDIGAVAVGVDVGPDGESKKGYLLIDTMIEARKQGAVKPYFVFGLTEKTKGDITREKCQANRICLFPSIRTSAECVRRIMDFSIYRPEEHDLRSAAGTEVSEEKSALPENEGKDLLRSIGINVPKRVILKNRDELDTLDSLRFPLAMKISSPDILHKTDAGCVMLNVPDKAAAAEAYDKIISNARAFKADAVIDGVLAEEMAKPGVELILGIVSDRQMGPMLLAGAGGIMTELVRDTSVCPVPVNRSEALSMLASLKTYKLLTGFRGSKPCDINAVADVMVALSEYAYGHAKEIAEIDINPLLVYENGQGAIALDALVVKNK